VIIIAFLFINVGCNVTNGWVANRSGMRQYKRGHFAMARHRFANAVAHDPCNPDYRHNLAMALQKQGETGACERILRHNLTIDAMHQPSYHSLAQMMVGQGRTAEASDLISGWVATQPYTPESNLEMAWVQRETGDIAGAEQSLQNALKADPTHPIALAHMGQLYHGTGRTDLATTYYQRSLAANWDQPEVQSRLATLVDPGLMTRSAMMQNTPLMVSAPVSAGDPMLVSAPMVTSDPMMASASMIGAPMMAANNPFGSDPQAVALEDLRSNPKPRDHRRRRGKDKDPVLAAYPLPNFDGPTTAWVPTGTIPGQPSMAFQPTTVSMDTMNVPQLADNSISTYAGPTLLPPSDPAHSSDAATEMTAALPVVDPH